jgi:hypothetical protein
MNLAVYFNDKPNLRAVKVSDKWPNRMLTPEGETFARMTFEPLPEQNLGMGHMFAKVPRQPDFRIIAHPCPLRLDKLATSPASQGRISHFFILPCQAGEVAARSPQGWCR